MGMEYMTKNILIYDTTLRDGTQGEHINFSAEEKLRIARRLDDIGFHYIEGGWPGSNPKDARFFNMIKRYPFKTSRLPAFGSTRRSQIRPEEDPSIEAILEAETATVTVFGKSWDLHATEILGVSLDENLAMIEDTILYLKDRGKEVVYDAEHFFDGYRRNHEYAVKTINAAVNGGADMVILCDTNGGILPHEVQDIMM